MCRDTGIDLKCRNERKGYLFAWGVDNKHQSSRPVPRSPTRRAAKQILARHAGRPGSLLQEPGFVDDQHAVRRAQVLDHIVAAQVARLVLVPQDMRQNPLGAPRAAVPDRFGQLPAVLALGRAEQPFQIETRLAPRLWTPE